MGRIVCTSYSRFCVENRKFSLPWQVQQGSAEPNVAGIGVVELADPENHTTEPKITTILFLYTTGVMAISKFSH